ncbi:MAG TPA: hypothetical protein VF228_23545 [Iamia sp.]
MPMRQDCKYYASRVYGSGDTMRTCELDLAPEAPWRCPADCGAYERRLADVGWHHGSLAPVRTPDEPPGLDERGEEIAALLDEAETIVSGAAEEARSEAEQEWLRAQRKGRIRRLFRRDR